MAVYKCYLCHKPMLKEVWEKSNGYCRKCAASNRRAYKIMHKIFKSEGK